MRLTKTQEQTRYAIPERFRDEAAWQLPVVLDFAHKSLASADESDELLSPGSFDAISVYQHMFIFGWIRRRDGRNGGPYIITEAGRRALEASDG